MKRDLDLMRQILFDAEVYDKDNFTYSSLGDENEGETATKTRLHHIHLLADLGFVTRYRPDNYSEVYRISDSGHNFIMLSRDNETWEKAKKEGLGIMSLIMELLIKWGSKNSEA